VGPIRNQSPRPSTPEQVDVPPAVPDAPSLEEHNREWRGGHSRPQTSSNFGQQPFYDPPRGRRQSDAAYVPPPPGYDRGRSRTRGPEQERSKHRSPSIPYDSGDEGIGKSSRADRPKYPPSTFNNPGRKSAYGPPPARGRRQSDAAYGPPPPGYDRGRSRTGIPEQERSKHRSSSIPYDEEMGRSSTADRQRYPPSTFDNPGRGSAYGPPPTRGRRQSGAAYGPPPPGHDRGRSTTRSPDDATNGYTRSSSKIRLKPGNSSYFPGDDRMAAESVREPVLDWDEHGNLIYGKSGLGSSSPTSPTWDYRRGSVKVPLPPLTHEYRRPGSSGSGFTGDLPFRSQPNSPPSSRDGVRFAGTRGYNVRRNSYFSDFAR
jgi:hypothetical protein